MSRRNEGVYDETVTALRRVRRHFARCVELMSRVARSYHPAVTLHSRGLVQYYLQVCVWKAGMQVVIFLLTWNAGGVYMPSPFGWNGAHASLTVQASVACLPQLLILPVL